MTPNQKKIKQEMVETQRELMESTLANLAIAYAKDCWDGMYEDEDIKWYLDLFKNMGESLRELSEMQDQLTTEETYADMI